MILRYICEKEEYEISMEYSEKDFYLIAHLVIQIKFDQTWNADFSVQSLE